MSGVKEWVFPEISQRIDIDDAKYHSAIAKEWDKLSKAKNNLIEEAERLEIESKRIEELSHEVNKKLSILNASINKYNHIDQVFDEELKGIIRQLISMIVLKLTKKRIKKSPAILEDFINEARTFVKDEKSIQSICFSSKDYEVVSKLSIAANFRCKFDDQLKSGDIVIHTANSAYFSLLKDKINQLLHSGADNEAQ